MKGKDPKKPDGDKAKKPTDKKPDAANKPDDSKKAEPVATKPKKYKPPW